jgi:lysophospholipase L1-like esterase
MSKPSSSDEQWITSRLPGSRGFTVRDAVICLGVAILLLLLFKGPSIKTQGERLKPGAIRSVVLAVGRPISAVTKPLPFDNWTHSLFGWLSPDEDLGNAPGFATAAGPVSATGANGIAPITPEAFNPADVGGKVTKRPLKTLLVTGDSLSQPLDTTLARRLAGNGVRTLREAHVGTGISKTLLVDWAKLSEVQAKKDKPDAVVVFIGANEGFPMAGPTGRQVQCCNPQWAAIYAGRVRRMMNTYRRNGATRIYWLTLPATRSKNLEIVAKTVNAAITVAGSAYGADVRVLDMVPVFTPGGKYRSAINVGGTEKIVRESDGIHLNQSGADVAANVVLAAIDKDFNTG